MDKAYDLPKPIYINQVVIFHFAGLKTAVLNVSKKLKTKQDKYNLAASFQSTINEILKIKCQKAIEMFLERHGSIKDKNFVIAGGVASNLSIRKI